MKTKAYCFVLLLLTLSIGASFAVAPANGWKNSLTPRGTKSKTLFVLASAGKANYSIIIPEKPTTQEEKAASDLSLYLKEISGAEFQVLRESGDLVSNTKYISIGNTNLLKNANIPETKLDLGSEGYVIAVNGQSMYLLGGNKRGPIYAVYALLEEDLGCRWYDRQSKPTIPHMANLQFRPVPRHYVPVLNVRDPLYWDACDKDWAIANKVNFTWLQVIPDEWGGSNKHAGNLSVHTYQVLMPPEKYFKDHPEYFSEINGKRRPAQLCLTNPDVLKILTNNVLDLIKSNPGSEYISVSPNDNTEYCECAKCKAIDDAEGTKAGTLIMFVNKVADVVAKEYPQVKITTLAYLGTYMPPKTIRPNKNVVIQLCTDRHAFTHPFEFVTETKDFQSAMDAWHSMGATMHIWDYTANYANYSLPMPNMPIIADNINFYKNHGADGVLLEGTYQGAGGENAVMRTWVSAKQLWDPGLPTIALMRDFIYGYYGSAADPIWEYNKMLWGIWENGHKLKKSKPQNDIFPQSIFYLPSAPFLTDDYISRSQKLFDKAESLAKDPETLRRVRLAEFPLLYTMMCKGVGYFDGREFLLGPAVKSSDPALHKKYLDVFNKLEEIANREKIDYFSESNGDAAGKIARWKQIITQNIPELSQIELSNVWKFRPDLQNTGVDERWYLPNTDDSSWANIRSNLDNGWESQGYSDFYGYSWYRQSFFLPKGFDIHKHLYMLFRGVDNDGEVYINGKKAFDHTCAATGLPPERIWNDPFMFDARPYLKSGEQNQIAVRVFRRGPMAGIHKPAHIVSTDADTDVEMLRIAIVLQKNKSK